MTNTEGGGNGAAEMEEDLPMPTFDNFQHIIDELSSASTEGILRKRRCCTIILQDEAAFLRKLHEMFEKAEDLMNFEALFNIFFIYKYMISLGDSKLIETIMSKDFYLFTFGALEYDPEHLNTSKGKDENATSMTHRDFLTNKVRFKTIVKINSEQILDSIHLVYRLNYLKDTAIARFVDDSVLSNINSLIYGHSNDIANHIFQNKEILQELLQKMRSTDIQMKHDAIEFFMEVCQMSKNMQISQRFNFFESLSQSSTNLIEILAESFNVYYPD